MKLQIFMLGMLIAVNIFGAAFGCMSPRSTPSSRSASPVFSNCVPQCVTPVNFEESVQRLSNIDDVYDVVYTAATSACIGEEFSYDEALSLAELILDTDSERNWNFDFSLESLDFKPSTKESEAELNENLKRFSETLYKAIEEIKSKN